MKFYKLSWICLLLLISCNPDRLRPQSWEGTYEGVYTSHEKIFVPDPDPLDPDLIRYKLDTVTNSEQVSISVEIEKETQQLSVNTPNVYWLTYEFTTEDEYVTSSEKGCYKEQLNFYDPYFLRSRQTCFRQDSLIIREDFSDVAGAEREVIFRGKKID